MNTDQTQGIDTSLPNKAIYKKFVLPMIISQIVMGIIQLGDRIIGAVFIGTSTLQIVSIVFPILIVGMAFGFMIMTGLGVEVNYLIGKRKNKEAEKIATFTLLVQLIISLVTALVLFIFQNQIIDFLIGNGDQSIKEDAKVYLGIIILVFPFFSTGFTLSSLILADGNPKYNMGGMMIFSFGNLVLNLIFVLGLGYGVEGLAYGTFASAVLFFLYNASFFIFKLNKNFKFGKFETNFKALGRIMYNGLSDFIVIGALGIMMVSINRIIQDNMSVEFFLAYSILTIVATLYIVVAEGSIYGLTPVISKLLGEKNIDKIKSLALYSYIRGVALTIILYLLVMPFATTLGGLFLTNDGTMPDEYFKIFKDDVLSTMFKLYLTIGLISIFDINSTFTSGLLSSVKKPLLSLFASAIRPVIFVPIFTIIFVTNFGDNGLAYGLLLAQTLYLPIGIFAVYLCFKLLKKEVKTK